MKTLVFFVGLFILAANITADGTNKPGLNKVRFEKAGSHSPVQLVKDGKPAAAIFIDLEYLRKKHEDIRAKVLKLTAQQLQEFIKLSTGAELPIVGKMPETGNVVVLGAGPETAKLGINLDKLTEEHFIVKTFPGKVVIAGKDYNKKYGYLYRSGTLFGVYDFLERFLGIRWYYPGELGTIIPKAKDLLITPIAYADGPENRKRLIYRFHGQKLLPRQRENKPGLIYARLRYGDSSDILVPCHTPLNWGKTYGKSHPEYFQMSASGKRIPGLWCYSEPGVIKQLINDLERFYKSKGKWKEPWGNWQHPSESCIPISPLDMPVSCYCPRCQKLFKKDSRYGYASPVLGRFINKLCCEVKKKWPDKTVAFLPYSNYTEAPEGINFPDNLAIVLCWMYSLANLKEPEIQKQELAVFNRWKKLVKKPVAHWIYTCWPADNTKAPFQYPHIMQRFFKMTKGSEGFFCDARVNWPRKHLTHYLMGRLMWNSDFDVDAALDEYYRLMYGRASGTMKEIFEILINGWERSRWSKPLPDTHRISLQNIHNETYPEKTVKKLESLIKKAAGEVPENSLEYERIAFFKKALVPFFEESKMFHHGGGKRIFDVLKTGSIPKIDGKLDDEEWKNAPAAEFVTLNEKSPKPTYRTSVKGLWIPDKGIVLGFRLSEPDVAGIKANCTQHDEAVYEDDCIEIFLDPEGKQKSFYQIIVNSNNTLFDMKHYDLGKSWNSKGVVSRSYKGKDFWSIEIFIPFETFGIKAFSGNNVAGKKRWNINFTRSRWSRPGSGGYELSRFSTSYDPVIKKSNLNFLNFAQMRFIE